MKVYLAGPITGCTYEGATDWRDDFIKMMPENILGMSPMRGKSHLASSESIAKELPENVLSNSRAIMTRDHFDCLNCDVILVNFSDSTKVSIGTVMEIAWAYAYRKPVVAIMGSDGIHDHPMVNEAIGYKVESLEQAAMVVKSILLPVPH